VALEELFDRVRGRGPGQVTAEGPPFTDGVPRRSAVLAALFDRDGQSEIVLTTRTWELRNHAGEVSFPGGRAETGESPVATALREAHEEVGIAPDDVDVIGELDHLVTFTSQSRIVPVVGALAAPPILRPNPGEVARAFTVPLVELLRSDVYRSEEWVVSDGVTIAISFFELDGETVWGATARMLVQLLSLAV
jgi:8-oxo-dGTP pyrophosphatase MutT (NUDIX family)